VPTGAFFPRKLHARAWRLPGTGRGWKILAGLLSVTLLLLILFAGEKSLFKLISLQREQQHLQISLEKIKAGNLKLSRQIKDLQANPQAVEPIAREELGLVYPGEILYRFVPPSEASPRER